MKKGNHVECSTSCLTLCLILIYLPKVLKVLKEYSVSFRLLQLLLRYSSRCYGCMNILVPTCELDLDCPQWKERKQRGTLIASD